MSKAGTDTIFNVIDWHEADEYDEEAKDWNYVARLFGRTKDDKSVCLKVLGFCPFVFVRLPKDYPPGLPEKVIAQLKAGSGRLANSIVSHDVVKRKYFMGFRADEEDYFIRLFIKTKRGVQEAARVLAKPFRFMNGYRNHVFEACETNIDPMLRLMHLKDIKPCGWVRVDGAKADDGQADDTTCDIALACDWKHIHSVEDNSLAPLKICSFDIECTSEDGNFPQASRPFDRIIQIGASFSRCGEFEPYKKAIITLGSCSELEGTAVVTCDTEADVLVRFRELVEREDPDILAGYNIFQFDEKYMADRAKLLRIENRTVHRLSRLNDHESALKSKELSSAASGDNVMHFFDTVGRVQVDLLKVLQRDPAVKLPSYKLDAVAETYFSDKIRSVAQASEGESLLEASNIGILAQGNFLRIEHDEFMIPGKFQISDIDHERGTMRLQTPGTNLSALQGKLMWCMVKDDIKPRDIFDCQEKGPDERRTIAKYCVQDCVLVSKLLHKLDVVTITISLSDVSFVPFSYIILRGQGIKALSLVAKKTLKAGYVLPVLNKNRDEGDTTYEGAIVFDPEIKFHRRPIVVLDYNSLYPSSIIDRNISHETIVLDPAYDNLPGYEYFQVTYHNGAGDQEVHRYATPTSGQRGVLPGLLQELIAERKKVKRDMESENDPFKKKILDGKQLALKITANSVYGQLGSTVGPIGFTPLAACTTARGREMLEIARDFVQTDFKPLLLAALSDGADALHAVLSCPERRASAAQQVAAVLAAYDVNPRVVYGDTDSIFCDMGLVRKDSGEDGVDKAALQASISLGQLASMFIKSQLSFPHNLEYEKTFHPLLLVRKKGYYGKKYEDNADHFKVISMGIVLKRRDNAPIVKKIISGLLQIMVDEIDVDKAMVYTRRSIKDLLGGKYPVDDFVTSKTLRAEYTGPKLSKGACDHDEVCAKASAKDATITWVCKRRGAAVVGITTDAKTSDDVIRHKHVHEAGSKGVWSWDNVKSSLAHVALAQRMASRDPGNAPKTNDRIPFVFVDMNDGSKKQLQADKVEHPDVVQEQGLQIDYLYYLTNQIINPTKQFLELMKPATEVDAMFKKYVEREQERKRPAQAREMLKREAVRRKAAAAVQSDAFTAAWSKFGFEVVPKENQCAPDVMSFEIDYTVRPTPPAKQETKRVTRKK